MKKVFVRLGLILGVIVSLALTGVTPASAAPGVVTLTNVSYSHGPFDARMENNNSGAWWVITVQKGAKVGEQSGHNSEPEGYWVAPGWCSRWSVNNGPWSSTFGTGWVGIFPGEGFQGEWHVRAYHYDC